MKALPAIEAMAVLTQAGMDHRPFLKTVDPLERMVDLIVAERVNDVNFANADQRLQNQANATGNRVGTIVAQALRDLAQAMRR